MHSADLKSVTVTKTVTTGSHPALFAVPSVYQPISSPQSPTLQLIKLRPIQAEKLPTADQI